MKSARCKKNIYLNGFYDQYCKEALLDDVMRRIVLISQSDISIDDEVTILRKCLDSYDDAKDRIVINLLGVARNRELLQNMPHRIEGDFAVTYELALNDEDPGNGMYIVRISNQMLEDWDVTEEDLFLQAQKNTRKMFSNYLLCLEQICMELQFMLAKADVSGCTYDNEANIFVTKKESAGNVYVLTNEEKYFGAGLIFDLRIRKLISERFDAPGCYIIPSSLHEVMIIPDTGDVDLNMLSDMVHTVNLTTVDAEDRLSDLVHYLDFSTGRIEVARK